MAILIVRRHGMDTYRDALVMQEDGTVLHKAYLERSNEIVTNTLESAQEAFSVVEVELHKGSVVSYVADEYVDGVMRSEA